jgi:hypothetical protein
MKNHCSDACLRPASISLLAATLLMTTGFLDFYFYYILPLSVFFTFI